MPIRTAGDLRAFLTDVMVGIKNGDVEADAANAISKIAHQINQSIATEIGTALQLEKMGKGHLAGSMLIGSASYAPETDRWCDQCDANISTENAAACKSRFCKLRPPASALTSPQRPPPPQEPPHD